MYSGVHQFYYEKSIEALKKAPEYFEQLNVTEFDVNENSMVAVSGEQLFEIILSLGYTQEFHVKNVERVAPVRYVYLDQAVSVVSHEHTNTMQWPPTAFSNTFCSHF